MKVCGNTHPVQIGMCLDQVENLMRKQVPATGAFLASNYPCPTNNNFVVFTKCGGHY